MPSGENDRHTACINSYYTDNLEELLNQLYKPGRERDTHFLYQRIAEITYKKRNDPQMRTLFKKTAIEHISKFESFIPSLRELFNTPNGPVPPSTPTFMWLATVFTEDGEYEKAIGVCDKAIELGLHDGTKGDYQGRIEKIIKKAAKQGITVKYESTIRMDDECQVFDASCSQDGLNSPRAKLDRFIETLEGKHGEEARQNEIERLASEYGMKHSKKEVQG